MVRILVIIVFICLDATDAARAQQDVQFPAGDAVTVFGEFVAAQGDARGTIMLFHQARSNLGEYGTIAPELVKAGYNVLAIDQRAGGGAWNRLNLTAQAAGPEAAQAGESYYTKALGDLEAALDYAAKQPARPIIAWGSGYSASLVLVLAATHPDLVGGVLAFSPAESFTSVSVRDAATKVKCPVFIASSSDPGEIADAKKLFDAIPGDVKTQWIPHHGLTGSPTLRREANPRGAAENWTAVRAFLAALGNKPGA
jgi:alpha-beta hydrolase superfamily lysophospholipase